MTMIVLVADEKDYDWEKKNVANSFGVVFAIAFCDLSDHTDKG
jgi:hypothetical protein